MTEHYCDKCKRTFPSWGAFSWHYPCRGAPTTTVVMIGTDKRGVRVMYQGSLANARERAKDLARAAIYRISVGGRNFYNSTDIDFLIEHHHDPYWLAQGIESEGG